MRPSVRTDVGPLLALPIGSVGAADGEALGAVVTRFLVWAASAFVAGLLIPDWRTFMGVVTIVAFWNVWPDPRSKR